MTDIRESRKEHEVSHFKNQRTHIYECPSIWVRYKAVTHYSRREHPHERIANKKCRTEYSSSGTCTIAYSARIGNRQSDIALELELTSNNCVRNCVRLYTCCLHRAPKKIYWKKRYNTDYILIFYILDLTCLMKSIQRIEDIKS